MLRRLWLLTLGFILLAGCSRPASISPTAAADWPTPAPLSTAGSPAPQPTLTPTQNASLHNSPSQLSLLTIGQMQLLASYPLFRRGIPQDVYWAPQGIIVSTHLGMDLLDSATLQTNHTFTGLQPVMPFNDGSWLACAEDGAYQQLNLAAFAAAPYPQRLPPCGEFGRTFTLSADNFYLANTSSPDSVTLTSLSTGEQRTLTLTTPTRLKFQVSALTFSPAADTLYALLFREDGYGELAAIHTGRMEQVYSINGVTQMPSFSADGSRMLYLGLNTLEVHLAVNGNLWMHVSSSFYTQLTTRQAALFTARHTAFTTENKVVALYSQEVRNRTEQVSNLSSSILVYDGGSGQVIQTLNNLPALVNAFAVSPDGKSYLTLTGDGVLRTWDAVDLKPLAQSAPYETSPLPAISPDGKLIAFPAGQTARVAHLESGEPLGEFGNYPNALRVEPAFAGVGTLAVTVQTPWEIGVDLFDIESGALVRTFTGVRDCIFTPDGKVMACARPLPTAWDVQSGEKLLGLEEEGWGYPTLDRSGTLTAYCRDEEKAVGVWDLAAKVQAARFALPEGALCGPMVFDPAAKKLAGGGWVYSLERGNYLSTFAADSWQPALFDLNGSVLISFPQVIDPATGVVAAELPAEAGPEVLFWLPDGVTLAVKYSDRLEVWGVTP